MLKKFFWITKILFPNNSQKKKNSCSGAPNLYFLAFVVHAQPEEMKAIDFYKTFCRMTLRTFLEKHNDHIFYKNPKLDS